MGRIVLYHIEASEKGDTQTALFDGQFLILANGLSAAHIEYAAEISGLNFLLSIGILKSSRTVASNGIEIELTDFLPQSHLCHQIVNELIHCGFALTYCLDGKQGCDA